MLGRDVILRAVRKLTREVTALVRERVVYIGAFLTFYVVFAPLEYISTIPPLSSYIINMKKTVFSGYKTPDQRFSANSKNL